MLPSPLREPVCRASKSAGRIVSSDAPPQSYILSAEECGSSATMTQHHTRCPPCNIAREAAGRLLDHCAAGARGRAAACPPNAAHMAAACSGCHMLLGTTGHTFCSGMRGSFVTSKDTTGAVGMPPGEHIL